MSTPRPVDPTTIDPEGDLSRTGDAALLALGSFWADQAEAEPDEARAEHLRDAARRVYSEAARRGVEGATYGYVSFLSRIDRIDEAVAVAEAEVERGGAPLHGTIAAYSGDKEQQAMLLRRAVQLGHEAAWPALGRTLALQVPQRATEALPPERANEIMRGVADSVGYFRDRLASQRSAEVAVGERSTTAAEFASHLESAAAAAQRLGRLEEAERYMYEAVQLTTTGPEAGSLVRDGRASHREGAIRGWNLLLQQSHGERRAREIVQEEIASGNKALLLQRAQDEIRAAFGETEGGSLSDPSRVDFDAARGFIESAIEDGVPGAAESWVDILGDAARYGNGDVWSQFQPGPDGTAVSVVGAEQADGREWVAEELRRAAEDAVERGADPRILYRAALSVRDVDPGTAWALTQMAADHGVEGAAGELRVRASDAAIEAIEGKSPQEVVQICAERAAMAEMFDPMDAEPIYRAGARALEGTELADEGKRFHERGWEIVVEAAKTGDAAALRAVEARLMNASSGDTYVGALRTDILDDLVSAIPDLAAEMPAEAGTMNWIVTGYAELLASGSPQLRVAEADDGGASLSTEERAAQLEKIGDSVMKAAALAVPGDSSVMDQALRHFERRNDAVAIEEVVSNALAQFAEPTTEGAESRRVDLVRKLGNSLDAQGRTDEADQVFAHEGYFVSGAWSDAISKRGLDLKEPLHPSQWETPGPDDGFGGPDAGGAPGPRFDPDLPGSPGAAAVLEDLGYGAEAGVDEPAPASDAFEVEQLDTDEPGGSRAAWSATRLSADDLREMQAEADPSDLGRHLGDTSTDIDF